MAASGSFSFSLVQIVDNWRVCHNQVDETGCIIKQNTDYIPQHIIVFSQFTSRTNYGINLEKGKGVDALICHVEARLKALVISTRTTQSVFTDMQTWLIPFRPTVEYEWSSIDILTLKHGWFYMGGGGYLSNKKGAATFWSLGVLLS